MSETCQDTPTGQQCVLCDRPGSWDRPSVTFDDWYPRPCPDPTPIPTPIVGPLHIVLALLLVALAIYYVLIHVL